MNNNYPHLSSDAIVDSVLNFIVTGDSNKKKLTAEELRIKELAKQALEENREVMVPLCKSLHGVLQQISALEEGFDETREKVSSIKNGLVELIESLLINYSSQIINSEMGIN